MAKPTSLTPDELTVQNPNPLAATVHKIQPRRGRPKKIEPINDTPLQIRVPEAEARAIKIAAAQSGQSISKLMLKCFHAYKP